MEHEKHKGKHMMPSGKMMKDSEMKKAHKKSGMKHKTKMYRE